MKAKEINEAIAGGATHFAYYDTMRGARGRTPKKVEVLEAPVAAFRGSSQKNAARVKFLTGHLAGGAGSHVVPLARIGAAWNERHDQTLAHAEAQAAAHRRRRDRQVAIPYGDVNARTDALLDAWDLLREAHERGVFAPHPTVDLRDRVDALLNPPKPKPIGAALAERQQS